MTRKNEEKTRQMNELTRPELEDEMRMNEEKTRMMEEPARQKMETRRIELLSPARDVDCGMAAIDHGADAVYIGAARFGARAAAGNSLEDIARLKDYARPFGVKIYVTLNTLLNPAELPEVRAMVSALEDIGVDALIVQDPIFRTFGTTLPLHASTQMDNRTAADVSLLWQQGYRQAVLARELSLADIRAIHAAVPQMPLEVFVHGALCVSYSGLCYASLHCFGRSANRGECAQFCRLKFSLRDASGRDVAEPAHWLSLKDLCRIDRLEELLDAGVSSFKIEGRLKDAAYVKNVTAAYRLRLDDILARRREYVRSSAGVSSFTFTPDVSKTFSRGFTDYLLDGRGPCGGDVASGILSPYTPKSIGPAVGTVAAINRSRKSIDVSGRGVTFANGDGLCFFSRQHSLVGFRVNRAEGSTLFVSPVPDDLAVGMTLHRNHDQAFAAQLSRPTAQRRLPVSLVFSATADGFSLQATAADGTSVSTSVVCQHEQAQRPQHDNYFRQLSRWGNTPFACQDFRVTFAEDYFVPNSVLTRLRQQLSALLLRRQPAVLPRLPEPVPVSAEDSGHPSGEAAGGVGETIPTTADGRRLLMQCRHCLRFTLGCCERHGGRRPAWREPLSLVMPDGRRFPLQFDCRHCQMLVTG